MKKRVEEKGGRADERDPRKRRWKEREGRGSLEKKKKQ